MPQSALITNTNPTPNQTPVNKGFLSLHEEFLKHGFVMTKNEMDQLVYADPNKLYDEFILCVEQNKINTSVPVANTNILYTTNFKSYYSASEHVLYHLNNIVNYKKPSQITTNDDPNEQ